MTIKRMLAALCACLLLTGCASLLEREYVVVEPHSSKFWESEAADTLRAENHQDIVNDLLLLIGQHTESATIRLYNFNEDVTVAELLDQATTEIQKETPLGAYAVEFITSTSQSQRGYDEISVQISYRRTPEQLQAVVNATTTEALSSLLESALDEEKSELAVRIGYWRQGDRERVDEIVAQLRESRELTETPPWLITYYPAEGTPGLVEFVLEGAQLPALPEAGNAPEEAEKAEDAEPAEDAETSLEEATEPGESLSAEPMAEQPESALKSEEENFAEKTG